jgi:polyphosphate glucokinase
MKILAIDVGGSHVKLLVSGGRTPREFKSGPSMTPRQMVRKVKRLTADWTFEVISIGYPGVVVGDRIVAEPPNLGPGWVGFDFRRALGRRVKVVNDAAMQALGEYQGGRMLFLGLGTGLGSAMVSDGRLEPMELGHLPYRKDRTYEDYLGLAGLKRLGERKWRKHVWGVVELFRRALQPESVVLGGGNARRLSHPPRGVRFGANANAFVGGFKLWEADFPDGCRRKFVLVRERPDAHR